MCNPIEKLTNFAADAINAVSDAISGTVDVIVDAVDDFIDVVTENLAFAVSGVNTVVNVLDSSVSTVVSAVNNVGKVVVDNAVQVIIEDIGGGLVKSTISVIDFTRDITVVVLDNGYKYLIENQIKVIAVLVDGIYVITVDTIEFVVEVQVGIIETVIDVYIEVWQEIVVPILEEIFAWFGIVDETVLFVDRTSVPLFGTNTLDVVQQARTQAALSMLATGESYFISYTRQASVAKGQMKGYYRYAENGHYINALPELTVKSTIINTAAIDTALPLHLGFIANRLSAVATFPRDEIFFKNKLQLYPYKYKPWSNSLTFKDPNGVLRSDYTFSSLVFNAFTKKYIITVQRIVQQAIFWIEGVTHVVEGQTASFTVKSNRVVPPGKSVTINLSYSGTATGYTPVTSAVMLAGTQQVVVPITVLNDVVANGNRSLIVTVDSITNTGVAFEDVAVGVQNQAVTTITDNEGVILTMNSIVATELSGVATIPVKLENASAGAFTVDYAFTDVEAIAGIDYVATPGTLNFAGTAGEIQNVIVPILPDSADDNETFILRFTSTSDVTVDITQQCIVTITDGTAVDPAPGTSVVTGTITENPYTKQRTMVITYHNSSKPSSEWFYWLYKFGDKTYPDITSEKDTLTNLEMLPVAILRKNKTFINKDKTTEEYLTTKALLNKIGLSLDDLIDNIKTNDGSTGGTGIANLDDAFINFSASPSTLNWLISKILYLSFYELIVVNNVQSTSNEYSITFEEQDIQNATVWTNHTFTPSLTGLLPNGKDYYHSISGNDLTILSKTATNIYDKIVVQGLNGMTSIKYAGHSQIAVSTLSDKNFTVPISHYTLNQLTVQDQMEVYQHILRMDLYSAQLVHIAWYETSTFTDLLQFTLIIITVVVAIVTAPTGGLGSLAFETLKQVLINIAITEMVVYIADKTGNAELAAVVGVITAIVLSQGAPISFDLTSSEGLLNASTNFADNLTAAHGVVNQQLGEDIAAVNTEFEARMKDIEDVNNKLNSQEITTEFIVALNSADTSIYPAVEAQYNFDLIYNYDRLVANYHNINLQTGVI